jgi:hypothetical protein
MPKQYEAIRNKLAKGAKPGSPAYDRAQSSAAAIYNSRHHDRPMSAAHPEGAPRKSSIGLEPITKKSRWHA